MVQYHDIDDLNHAPELAVALGNMMVAWAKAEVALSCAFALVCGLNANTAIMGYYRIPTFEARVKFIRALLAEWKTQKHDKAAIDACIERLSKLSKTRNDWVHGIWSMDRTTKQTVVFDFRAPEDKGRQKPVKAHDVNNHVATVRNQANILQGLVPWDDIAP